MLTFLYDFFIDNPVIVGVTSVTLVTLVTSIFLQNKKLNENLATHKLEKLNENPENLVNLKSLIEQNRKELETVIDGSNSIPIENTVEFINSNDFYADKIVAYDKKLSYHEIIAYDKICDALPNFIMHKYTTIPEKVTELNEILINVHNFEINSKETKPIFDEIILNFIGNEQPKYLFQNSEKLSEFFRVKINTMSAHDSVIEFWQNLIVLQYHHHLLLTEQKLIYYENFLEYSILLFGNI